MDRKVGYVVWQVSEVEIGQQYFQALQMRRGASDAEMEAVLNSRELVEPETDLTPEMIAQAEQLIRDGMKVKV